MDRSPLVVPIDMAGAEPEHVREVIVGRGDVLIYEHGDRVSYVAVAARRDASTVAIDALAPFDNLPARTQTLCVPGRGPKLDGTDHALLALLQRDGSKTLFDLGQGVGLSTSAVQRRISRFHQAGLIEREVAVLNSAAFPDVVLALVLVTLERESSERHKAVQERLSASPAVQQGYDLAGEYDYAVLIAARGMNELREVVEDLFMDAPGLKRFDTFPIYRVIKTGLEIPTE